MEIGQNGLKISKRHQNLGQHTGQGVKMDFWACSVQNSGILARQPCLILHPARIPSPFSLVTVGSPGVNRVARNRRPVAIWGINTSNTYPPLPLCAPQHTLRPNPSQWVP